MRTMILLLIPFLVFGAVCRPVCGATIDDPPRELPGLHNVHKAGENVIVGSEPHGEKAFAELKKLGIRTIVSVDGAKPDTETARRFGIRYIHIPIGYDRIESTATLSLTRVAREVDSPVYVHCHHGKHRGPAAAALLCIAAGTMSHDQATDLMTRAGTGKNYQGLWRDVRAFRKPDQDTKLPELVEVSQVDSMVAAMASLDRSFEHLKLCAKSEWSTPVDHPDLVPAAEALLVYEGLYESERHLNASHDQKFRTWLRESVVLSENLRRSIEEKDREAATLHFQNLEQKCSQCHQVYRNQ